MKKPSLLYGLKSFGFLVSLYTLLFWLIYLQKFNARIDESGYERGAERFLLPILMIIAGLLTSWASIKAKPKLLFICAVLSFFSIGYYFIKSNSLFFMSLGIAYISLIIISVALFATQGRTGSRSN